MASLKTVSTAASDGASADLSEAAWATVTGCGCPICSAARSFSVDAPVADDAGIPQLDAQGFLLDPSNPASGLVGTTLGGLPVWSAYQTAAHIARPGGTWADYTTDLSVSYSFGVGATLPKGYEAFSTPEARAGALRAMALYADVCGLTFHEAADPDTAQITYMFGIGSTNGGGWANYPSAGGGYVQVGHVSWEQEMLPGSYSLNLLLHELGHGVGLAHPGEYNGDTATYADADHFNDSGQYTNMSYWGESYTGASFSDLATLGLHDILAVQMEYGANWSTRSANTVYGFHSTAGLDSYNFNVDPEMGFCIWDGGGKDALDFSGFSRATVMDLRQGAFSSTGLSTYNVSIAYGAIVENATGGDGADKMRGNDAANELRGGAGDDTIYGGDETPPANSVDPRDFIGVELNAAPLTRNQYMSATNVTAFSGAAFTFEEMVKITRSPSDAIVFASYNKSGNDNQFLLSATNDGSVEITIANRATYVTDFATTKLIDGNAHRLSLTWDKTSGAVALYVDGALVHAGTYAAAIGANVASGGTLVLGQEQDSLGGGFDPTQIFQGVTGDIRIFSDVRTAQEVAASAFTQLAGGEQGLVHNWRVGTGATNTISDLTGARTLSVVNGALVRNTAPGAVTTPDNDKLVGGIGNDTLYGGAGADMLIGGGSGSGFAPVHGVEMNAGAVTDQYAEIGNYAGISGAAGAVQFSLEFLFQVSHLPSGEVDFVSYANSQTANAFGVTANNNGTVDITFRGSVYDTGVASSLLTDGKLHRLSLTWDGRAASKGFVLYLDGAAVASGVHAQQTASLNAGGALIFGQEQDSIGGGFQSSQIFPGVIADIRVFNKVRSAAEIAADAFAPLANPSAVAGLVNNWQATAATTTSVADARGGAALTLVNAPSLSRIGDWDDDSLFGGLGDDTLDGGDGDDLLDGGAGNDRLSGDAGADTLAGQEGDDRLLGGDGANILNGGAGDDIFYVASAADQIVEAAEAGSKDRVYASVGYALTAGQEVEYLYAYGAAATSGAALTGNEFANIIYGGAGVDTLNGGAGADILDGRGGGDSMTGGSGNDKFYVDSAADQVFESAETGSVDRVYASVSYVLTAGQEVEYLQAQGAAATGGVALTGNESANRIYGGAGDDTLDGGDGADWLYGQGGDDRLIDGLGRDSLQGGDGFDTFVLQKLPANRDTIYDFSSANDQLEISASLFGAGLGAGAALGGKQFIANHTGRASDGGDSSTRFVYNLDTGALAFDSNGAPNGGAVLIATLYSAGATPALLAAADFTIVA